MSHLYDRLTVIATPIHVHGTPTPEAYEAKHRKQMRGLQHMRPALNIRDPWDAPDGALVFVSGGKWLVICDCGNGPSADPVWDVARCFDCGAVYRRLLWPAERDAIEAVLCLRPSTRRHWLPPETLDDLRAENVAHGLEVPA